MTKKVCLVLDEECVGCEACITECPTHALEIIGNVAWSNPQLCDGEEKCGKCAPSCPVETIIYVDENDPRLKEYASKHGK